MSITKINSLGINLTSPTTFSAGTAALPSITFSGDTNTGVFAPAADTVAFTEGGAEAMRITSAGALCINSTTSAISGITDGYIGIDVSNASRTGININSVTENQPAIGLRKHNSTGTSYPLYMLNAANSNVGSVSMTNTAVAFNTSSDYRLKENVNYNFDATTRLKQLKPARFNFIADANKTVDGFLAHEVQSVIPEAITGIKDEVDSKGKPVYQGIDQSKLTPILTKALQEAIAKIEQLEATNTSQQTKIDSLEARLTALES